MTYQGPAVKPVSKTPYEIRLELLQLSQKILQSRFDSNSIMQAPTSEDIIAEAEKLNIFVSKASQSSAH